MIARAFLCIQLLLAFRNCEKPIGEARESSAQILLSASVSGLHGRVGGILELRESGLLRWRGCANLDFCAVVCAERECACARERDRFWALRNRFRWNELA